MTDTSSYWRGPAHASQSPYASRAAFGSRLARYAARNENFVALSLAAIDIWYSVKGRISKVYLCDAAAEIALAGKLTSTAVQADGKRTPAEREMLEANRFA